MKALHELDTLIRAARGHASEVLLLLVGFDGVLTDSRDDPDTVFLSPRRRELLGRLMALPAVGVGLVSGRRVADLQRRANVGDEAFYVGCHGLEVVGPGFSRVQRDVFDRYRDPIQEVVSIYEPFLSEVAGARLENKEAVIALHTRRAGPVDATWTRLHLLNDASNLVNSQVLRVIRGNHVLELLPNVGRVKAEAVSAIHALLAGRYQRSVFTMYVGEDVADDDAVEAVAGRGISAVVGRRGRHAQCHLAAPAVLDELIEALIRVRQTPVAAGPPAVHASIE